MVFARTTPDARGTRQTLVTAPRLRNLARKFAGYPPGAVRATQPL